MIRTFKAEGVILKRLNFGEADRILTIYTKHYGKIKVIAKGVRKINSRRGGSVELFNWVVAVLHKTKNFDLLTEIQIIDCFKSWRKDLKKVAFAYSFCEAVDKLTPEGSEQKEVFALLTSYLNNLGQTQKENLCQFADSFKENLLKIIGFWPRDKVFPVGFDFNALIEEICERKLKSSSFLKEVG